MSKEKLIQEIMKSDEDLGLYDHVDVGDIILVRGGSWLSKRIQFFMNIYRKRLGLPKRVLYNHVAVVVEDGWGMVYVAEANAKGIEMKISPQEYLDTHTCKVMTWRKPLTKAEKSKFSREASYFMHDPTRYEFLNFFHQIYYIFTGKWIGRTGSKSYDVLYCSEFAAVLMYKVRGSFKGETWNKNPLDIELSTELKEKVL
jgi:hypothetical protein